MDRIKEKELRKEVLKEQFKQDSKKEFKKLIKINSQLRRNLAIELCTLTEEQQKRIWDILNEIVNNEIEQEKICNQ